MAIRREQFVEAARTYLGAPYLHQGRTRAGLDCVGLVVAAARDCGLLTLEEFEAVPRDYLPNPDGKRLPALLHKHAERIGDPAEARAGDLIMIKYDQHPQHLAIIERTTQWGPFIIHSFGPRGVCNHMMDQIWLNQWGARIHAVCRMRRIED